jgi:hypothetical protein
VHDAAQPATESRRFPQAVQIAEDLYESILRGVLGQVKVAQ